MTPDPSQETRLNSDSVISTTDPELPFVDASDRLKHLRCIETIAEEMQRSVEEVAPIYEEVLEYLNAKARIQDYLLILVSKHVKHILNGSRSDDT
jgi:hypothetical protein